MTDEQKAIIKAKILHQEQDKRLVWEKRIQEHKVLKLYKTQIKEGKILRGDKI